MKNKIIVILLMFIYFALMNYYIYNSLNINYNINLFINKAIYIPSINLKLYVRKANENFTNLNNSLVYYRYFNTDNRIIILGHSGMGYKTYFNRLDEILIGDNVYLFSNGKRFKYEVKSVFKVDESYAKILDNKINSYELLLITCDKNNKNKRLVVKSLLKSANFVDK